MRRVLTEELKHTIQGAYSALLGAKGYAPRSCQRTMIAEVARTLSTDGDNERAGHKHVVVIEAGTGTGKTVAYMLAAIPVARALGKRLVVATATVALQEQIVGKDLPDLGMGTGLSFTYTLAKGRRRYLCLARLDEALQESKAPMPLFDDETGSPLSESKDLVASMVAQLMAGDWSGDRDEWPEEIEDQVWTQLTSDHVQCTNRQCSHFDNCVYFKAREDVFRSDCIVANQDLVLADLAMGGGAVLPEPEDTIYVFDEGHHLPDKAVNHGRAEVRLGDEHGWIEQVPHLLEVARGLNIVVNFNSRLVTEKVADLTRGLEQMRRVLEVAGPAAGKALRRGPDPTSGSGGARQGRQDNGVSRFPHGEVPINVRELAHDLRNGFDSLFGAIERLREAADDELRGEDGAPEVEALMPMLGALYRRLETNRDLWGSYGAEDHSDTPPTARWVQTRDYDLQVSSSPIDVAIILKERLWDRCHAALVTSATLAVAGDFERFCRKAGIERDANFRALASPFRHAEQAELVVPALQDADPRDPETHWSAVAAHLPDLIGDTQGTLVLFTSWRQLLSVRDLVEGEFGDELLVQGDLSRTEILTRHRAAIDAGGRSIIFGLASFAEGVDLPGAYCEHVIIVKIPFATPDDPVGATLNEWIEARGGNPFREISLPDAALRLVQSCGRLLRTETDSGRITVLDRRLADAWYGKMLLSALPPFRRTIEGA